RSLEIVGELSAPAEATVAIDIALVEAACIIVCAVAATLRQRQAVVAPLADHAGVQQEISVKRNRGFGTGRDPEEIAGDPRRRGFRVGGRRGAEAGQTPGHRQGDAALEAEGLTSRSCQCKAEK